MLLKYVSEVTLAANGMVLPDGSCIRDSQLIRGGRRRKRPVTKRNSSEDSGAMAGASSSHALAVTPDVSDALGVLH